MQVLNNPVTVGCLSQGQEDSAMVCRRSIHPADGLDEYLALLVMLWVLPDV
ncbi:hypothetical protein D3C84_1145680 [compost metagenome]